MRRFYRTRTTRSLLWTGLLSLSFAVICPYLAVFRPIFGSEPDNSPEQLYRTGCADCHGDRGEGTDEYEHPLEGSLSVARLTKLIGETMPADDPRSLSRDEYKAVAAYIHDAIYSPIARERNRPARIDLARLTVRQYRQTLADLIGSFHEPVQWGDARGLHGEYFEGRRIRSSVAKRVDRHVNFDYGTEAPVQDRTLILHGVADRVRGDGDNHMRGIGCLLTGIELFPGNIQGGSHTPAGWASGISIDQEIRNLLQKDPKTRTRFGSLEFGVMVPIRADTWTRMAYTGPNKPLAPTNPTRMNRPKRS